jgi:hypothetical protein
MDETKLIALFVRVTFFGLIGLVAQSNSNQHHVAQRQERNERRLNRAIEKWNRLFAMEQGIKGALVHKNFYNETVILANKQMDDGKTEEASIIFEEALLDFKKHHKVLRARHKQLKDTTIQIPPISRDDCHVLVKSYDEEKPPYQVDMNRRTCSCQTSMEQNLPYDDMRRICRHQVSVMRERGIYPKFNNPYDGLILKAVYRDQYYQILQIDDYEILIGYNEPLEWISVWFVAKFSRDRFGYNILSKHWAYGGSPPGYANKIKIAINKALHLV